MRPFFCTLLLFLAASAYSQEIRGIVLDKETEEPLINANVYFNGTYKGTMTDTAGYFSLDPANHQHHTLVISSLGYYSESLFEYPLDELIRVKLTPKVLQIDEVQVVYDKSKAERLRKKGVKLFTKEYLGNTYNARKTEILNIEDIKFHFSEDEEKFEAFADKPIKIYNGALGYDVSYHLDFFVKTTDDLSYKGTHFFVEDTTKRKWKTKRMVQRRKNTYKGSRMHFFRSLYSDSFDDEGFILRDSLTKEISYKDVITGIDNNARYLTYKGEFFLYYYPYKNNDLNFVISIVNVEEDSVLFTGDGYFDPNKIIWSGISGKKRVGDLLPFEYEPEK